MNFSNGNGRNRTHLNVYHSRLFEDSSSGFSGVCLGTYLLCPYPYLHHGPCPCGGLYLCPGRCVPSSGLFDGGRCEMTCCEIGVLDHAEPRAANLITWYLLFSLSLTRSPGSPLVQWRKILMLNRGRTMNRGLCSADTRCLSRQSSSALMELCWHLQVSFAS